MKNILIILSFIFLLSIIICVDNNNDKIEKQNIDKNKDESISNENENNNNENEENEEENDKNLKGIYMTQKSFDERLNKIFEEKGLKNRKKITKEKLKIIFEEIYSDELKPSDTDTESGMTPEEEAQRFVDLIFNELTRSYDYDDKIKISEIRDMISPKQAQDAMFTVYADLAGSMGFL